MRKQWWQRTMYKERCNALKLKIIGHETDTILKF